MKSSIRVVARRRPQAVPAAPRVAAHATLARSCRHATTNTATPTAPRSPAAASGGTARIRTVVSQRSGRETARERSP
ncbi:MAG: hypothetical protein IPN03_23975 [Holophagales bacterium]|nr:hypothetical protein [Holophagales bacterium]